MLDLICFSWEISVKHTDLTWAQLKNTIVHHTENWQKNLEFRTSTMTFANHTISTWTINDNISHVRNLKLSLQQENVSKMIAHLWLLAGRNKIISTISNITKRRCQKASSTQRSFQSFIQREMIRWVLHNPIAFSR